MFIISVILLSTKHNVLIIPLKGMSSHCAITILVQETEIQNRNLTTDS